jgi:LytTr DNA-binding domain
MCRDKDMPARYNHRTAVMVIATMVITTKVGVAPRPTPMIEAPMEQATQDSVQPPRDGWSFRRDEWQGAGAGGTDPGTNGWRLSIRSIYVGIAVIVATACLVNVFSVDYDLTRLGRPHRFWEPFVGAASSAVLVIALLALPRQAGALAAALASRPLRSGLSLIGLALTFSAMHICGMVLLRDLVYAAAGATYSFNWSIGEVIYELRKDLFSFSIIGVIFWLAERAFAPPGPIVRTSVGHRDASAAAPPPYLPPQAGEGREGDAGGRLWLRDGRTSILVDAGDILYITSAGNYVEYVMATGPRHLIRTTLQAEAARLSRLGIARVHRTRLVNAKRIAAVTWRQSGDFDLRLDNGETIAGSRRYKAAVRGIGT